jgi:hypothetical protein
LASAAGVITGVAVLVDEAAVGAVGGIGPGAVDGVEPVTGVKLGGEPVAVEGAGVELVDTELVDVNVDVEVDGAAAEFGVAAGLGWGGAGGFGGAASGASSGGTGGTLKAR